MRSRKPPKNIGLEGPPVTLYQKMNHFQPAIDPLDQIIHWSPFCPLRHQLINKSVFQNHFALSCRHNPAGGSGMVVLEGKANLHEQTVLGTLARADDHAH